MPATVDKYRLNKFTDRRVKLLPCQKEMIVYWHNTGHSINGLARMFKVNKRMIQFILFPERLELNKQHRRDRGGSKVYYDKNKHRESMAEHRKYKEHVYKTGEKDT
jgi:hypothetical protein